MYVVAHAKWKKIALPMATTRSIYLSVETYNGRDKVLYAEDSVTKLAE